MKAFAPVLHLLHWLWACVRLGFYTWARREMCASHPDMPEVFWKAQKLRDAINSNPLRIGAPY
jgi:hypothetical protein